MGLDSGQLTPNEASEGLARQDGCRAGMAGRMRDLGMRSGRNPPGKSALAKEERSWVAVGGERAREREQGQGRPWRSKEGSETG